MGAFPRAPRFSKYFCICLLSGLFFFFFAFLFRAFYLPLRSQLKSQVKDREGQNLSKKLWVCKRGWRRGTACWSHERGMVDVSPSSPRAFFSLRYLKLGMSATLGTCSARSSHKYTRAHQLEFHAHKRETSINHPHPFFKRTTNSKKYPKDSFSESGYVWFCGVVVEFCGMGVRVV